MKTRTYEELLELISALCGVAFATIELPRIRALINRRAKKAYRATNYWTRFLKIGEERRRSGDSISASSIVAGSAYYINATGTTNYEDIGLPWNSVFDGSISGNTLTVAVMHSGTIPIGDFITDVDSFGDVRITAFLTGTGGIGTYTISNSPGSISLISMASQSSGAYFVATGSGAGTGTVFPALNYIPYAESGKDTIDTYLRIQRDQPYLTASVQDYEFTVGALGATIVAGNLNPSLAWVTYKATHDILYGSGSLESFFIPDEWFEYLAHGTYADYLRAEGQQERAVVADQEADLILQDELMRLDEQHTQTLISNRIFTNSNMQLRW
jgi:hypothetical protein